MSHIKAGHASATYHFSNAPREASEHRAYPYDRTMIRHGNIAGARKQHGGALEAVTLVVAGPLWIDGRRTPMEAH